VRGGTGCLFGFLFLYVFFKCLMAGERETYELVVDMRCTLLDCPYRIHVDRIRTERVFHLRERLSSNRNRKFPSPLPTHGLTNTLLDVSQISPHPHPYPNYPTRRNLHNILLRILPLLSPR
jgi:hypothetical protein